MTTIPTITAYIICHDYNDAAWRRRHNDELEWELRVRNDTMIRSHSLNEVLAEARRILGNCTLNVWSIFKGEYQSELSTEAE